MYQIVYHESVVSDLKKITKTDKQKIKKSIEKKLAQNPLLYGEPLRSSLSGYRKLRVGEYRIVYVIQPQDRTLIIIIAHRKDVYERVHKRID